MRLFGKDRALTFNLARPPEFVNSRNYPGVQLADVIASAIAMAMQKKIRNQLDKQCHAWLTKVHPAIVEDCILPELKAIDLDRSGGFVNTMILTELVDRSLQKKNLFDGMPEYIESVRRAYPAYRASLADKEAPVPRPIRSQDQH